MGKRKEKESLGEKNKSARVAGLPHFQKASERSISTGKHLKLLKDQKKY